MNTLVNFYRKPSRLLKSWAVLIVGLGCLSAGFARNRVPDPPSVLQLQKAIAEAGGWEKNAGGPIIIVLGGGGSCECSVRDPKTGRCLLYICNSAFKQNPHPLTHCKCILKDPVTGKCLKFSCPSDAQQKAWGPIRVPRPEAK
ncbi:MAG TPA: hypothetical protein VFZ34_25870 [Blastocatellia bacterium]|nr:hypothetical protein [Blastocatellia bacterium]